MSKTVIETVTFKLNDGMSREGAAKAAAAEIGKTPGNADFLSAIDGPTVQLHSELEVVIN